MTTSANYQIVFRSALLLASTLAVAACSGDGRSLKEAVETDQLDLKTLSIEAPPGFVTEPKLVVNPGEQINFLVSAENSIGSPVTLSSGDRRWTVDQPAFASIGSNGNFTAIANGAVNVNLQIGGLEASYPVEISDANLQSINEISGSDSLERCIPDTYGVTGTFADGSVRGLFNVDWRIANPDSGFVGAVEQDGSVLVTATNAGTLELSAAVGSVESVTPLAVTVEDNLDSINITPVNIEIKEDATLQLTARGSYTRDGNVVRPIINENVSWSIANPGVATVSSTGVVEGVEVGNTSITVGCGDMTVDKAIAVVDEGSTADPELAFENGASQTFSLTGDVSVQLRVSTGDTYSSANQPESSEIEWSIVSVSSPDLITLSEEGLVTFLGTGSATIRATVGEDSADLILTIEP